MKTIDIKTTQNVTITYELAETRDRVLAFIVDNAIKTLFTYLMAWIFMFLADFEEEAFMYFALIVLTPVQTFYTLFWESIRNGQTPGKMLLKIKVMKLDGGQPSFYDYMIRWTFRIVDIWLSSGIVAMMLVISGEKSQRIGDLTTNSVVVRVSNKIQISLNDILKIDNRQNYEPRYPGIAGFAEDDILLIKQTIERYNRYRNKAHDEAMRDLCERIREKLDIREPIQDNLVFLKTLIRDYIVLTR